MTDVEILTEYYGISEERAEIFKHYASSKVAISAYRAGYEKGQQEGFQKANSQDYYIGLED